MSADKAPVAPVAAFPPLGDFDYQVQRSIETDSKMSAVLLATTAQQRPVVLKIARVDQRARAETNRQAIHNTVLWLRRLGQHDGLVRLYPVAVKSHGRGLARPQEPVYCATLRQWPGEPEFLVMEYLAGGSLREFVGAHPLGVDVALAIAHQLAEALAFVHRQGCVHRDMKPENILFRSLPRGGATGGVTGGKQLGQLRPVLVDFGVAAPRGERRLVSGSRLWMAPELQEAYEQSPLPVDPAWDVYALGLILCYMVSGRRPRRRSYEYASVLAYRDHALAVLAQELKNRGSGVMALHAPLAQLIASMLAREAAKRPAAEAVAATTAALLADLGAPLLRPARLRAPAGKSWSLPPKKYVQLALAAALVLGVLGGGLGGLLISLPAAVDARDHDALAAASPAQTRTVAASSTPGPGDAEPAVRQRPVAARTQIAAVPLPPAPTRLPLAPAAAGLAPTLVPFVVPASVPPTLVPFTPVAQAIPAVPATPVPTAPAVTLPTAPPATAAPAAPAIPPATAVPARREPQASPTPQATATAAAAPVMEQVQLLAPEPGTRSDQGKVEFSWQLGATPLADDHCFELVFWNPDTSGDKRSPVGAGKATRRQVDFTLLFNSSDPVLRALAHSDRDFNWGVRIVACAAPRTILQDVQEVRTYSYKGQ